MPETSSLGENSRRVRLKLGPADLEPIARALEGATPALALRQVADACVAQSAAGALAPVLVRALCSVLADLTTQGWRIAIDGQHLDIRAPRAVAAAGEEHEAVKARVRFALEAVRAKALAEAPTQEFIRRMEIRRLVRGRRVSILDLVDSGADLAERLGSISASSPPEADEELAALIQPRVQPVVAEAKCEHTDLPLLDVWRYFRLTWALPYRSTPGRTFPFLLRNDARPGCPVMGIGALASPFAQLTRRDEWIGWTLPALKRRLARDPAWWPRQLKAMLGTVARAASDLRADDLLLAAAASGAPLEEALLTISRDAGSRRIQTLQPRRSPTAASPGEDATAKRGDAPASQRVPIGDDGRPDWRAASEDLLFVRKRARVLADLLTAQPALARAPVDPEEALAALEADERFARAVSIALRECRKAGLASRVLDLSVCGAVAPYGPLLVGKLVALAVGSRELREAYRARYADQVSEIASQMAGREVRRPADYYAVSTTSLYGVASSQYNRLALTVKWSDGPATLQWADLGQSLGFGTVHLSRGTIAALTAATEASFGGRNVNYRFGEGNSPTLRQAREGLELIVDAPNALLNHEAPRRVYGFAAAPDALDALCVNEACAPVAPSFRDIAVAWRARWLRARLNVVLATGAVAEQGPHSVKGRLAVADVDDPQLGLF